MRAAVTEGPGCIRLADRPEPGPPGPGQTLLRVETVGICGSDLHLYRADLGPSHDGLLPRVQGHEFSAVVATADPAGGPAAGERVAVWPVLPCGACRPCREGRVNVCSRLRLLGVHRDGALQEHLLVDTAALVVTTGLTAEQTSLVEPVSIAVHAVARGRVAPQESVVVLGAGPIGAACALAARDAGGDVLVVDPVASRRELLASLGFPAVAPDAPGLAAAVDAHAGPEGPHVVIDTTGAPAVLGTAMDLAGHGGRVVVVGMTAASAPTSPGPLPIKELDVLGVSCCTYAEFAAAVELVRRNTAAIDALVSHVVPLTGTTDALHLLEGRAAEAVKVLVDLRAPAPSPDREDPA
ncbi:zinc-binding dehydrogenase [Geodermatophilus ruber]|uniref:Threonine dehydrogenase n=1 Tax=Geodermatophilus ruber TaxID=504800 RepID=A0A1I4HPD4_9ACTN|nr:alcohol dehydrogenase catalytic domain-containing protein [Geodermatophilus ruber]SFL44022.1 Threonine dehydrogenase [Geodermatophilus ruber]